MRLVHIGISLLLFLSVSINLLLYFNLKETQTGLTSQIVKLKDIKHRQEEKLLLYELQEEIVKIRGLGFLRPVIYNSMDREEVSNIIQKKLKEELTVLDEKILKKFGFLAPGEEILSHLTALYKEQVGGMYDEETGRMVLVRGLPLTGNIQRMFLIHELTHALQDHNFDLESLPLNTDNDDEALACLALVEGDATLAMFDYYKRHLKAYKIFWDLLSYLSVDQTELYSSPYFIRENLIFPYKEGLKFVTNIYNINGWQGINSVYSNLPVSTEQIMHPEKYLRDKPISVNIKEDIPGWDLLDSNTMGEFNIRLLFSIYFGEYESIVPSSGWGGDKWKVWESKETGELKVIWVTVWDTPEDADEFFNASRRLIRKRYPYITKARISKKGTAVKLYW